VHKITAHVLYSITFSRKACRLSDNVENIVKPDGQATEGKMEHAHCMLILKATNTLRIFNIYCLSTSTMVTTKQLNFKL
jgi:hypothetical protein